MDFNKVLKDIKPTKEEYDKVYYLLNRLIHIINDYATEGNLNAEAVLVGSVAKDTWLHKKADIDIFIKFPLDTPDDNLKEIGLRLGRKCIETSHGTFEYRYASHPYITGFIEGYEIDFVPCYTITSAEQLKSAVDRTILHTDYIKGKLKDEQKDEVLLLKKFMEIIHTYGADIKVGGFSGYLCELLIIYYGSFIDVLEAASKKWNPKIIIDIENHRTSQQFSEPMIVIDPTDKNRNVSAALKLQKLSEFVIASRNFLNNPKEDYFYKKEFKIDLNSIKDNFLKRDTKTLLITFKPPYVPADSLYSQIKKTENSIKEALEREDFKPLDTASWTDEKEKVIILLELEVWKLPSVKKHYGPPIWSQEHQNRFISKYGDKAYIEEDKWAVLNERKYNNAESFLEDNLSGKKIGLLRFGKHIKNEISKEHIIIDVLDYLKSSHCSEDELLFLFEYLNKNIHLNR